MTSDMGAARAPSGAAILAAVEALWAAIRERHPDVPIVVHTLASGSPSGRGTFLTYGHHAADRWQRGSDGQRFGEVMVSGEGLSRTPVEVLGTVLHEAAHGAAFVRGVKDTSRQGRYHNERFRRIGEEFGLTLELDGKIGWSKTSVPRGTADAYVESLTILGAAMTVFRHIESKGTKADAAPSRSAVLVCPGCGRRLRISFSGLAIGPIECVPCTLLFESKEDDE